MTRPLTLCAALISLTLAGCNGSPTEVLGGSQVFSGTVMDDSSVTHTLVITRRGGVRLELTSLVADPPLDEGVTPTVGLAVGEPDAASGLCLSSFSTSLAQGRQLAIGLEEQEYCLRLFDNGTLGVGDTRIYTLTVTPSE